MIVAGSPPSTSRTASTKNWLELIAPEPSLGGGVGYLLFLGAIIFFKPFAEYCIELYGSATSYLHGLTAMLGF